MQLELRLAQAERRMGIAMRLTIIALLMVISGVFLAEALGFTAPNPNGSTASVVAITVIVLPIVALIVFYLGLGSYLLRFAPRVRRLRRELENESIRELRREVAELRQMLAKRDP